MDTSILRKAGLTESQAKGYLALIENGALTPMELANHTGETRTNAYAIADKLLQFNLATKQNTKPVTYTASHPSALETLAERRRKAIQQNEQAVKNGLDELIDLYYEKSETPGVRYLNGKDGLSKVYDDILATKDTLHLLRTPNEKKYVGPEAFKAFVANRIKAGIPVDAITPYTDRANVDLAQDEKNLMSRQFFPEDMYVSPVEIDVYGSKVGFLSFGEDLAGVIIENKNIADAMRELFEMAKIGADTAFNARPELVEKLANERAALSNQSD